LAICNFSQQLEISIAGLSDEQIAFPAA
jgi:hypothetical protein